MPSTDDPGPLDGLSYSAAEWRRMDAMDFMTNGAAGGATGGIRPGDPGLAVSLVGSAITVTAGVCVAAHAGFGTYRASFPSSTTGLTVAAADATNPRVDLVYVRVWDNAVDGAGLSKTDIVYLQGTAAVSPVAPTPGALEIYTPLATISVPKSGSGSPSVNTAARAITVAPGGISPSASAAGTYAGQYRDGGTLQRYNGSSWEDKWYLAQAGQINIGSSISSATIAAALASTATFLLSSRVAGDANNRFTSTSTGQLQWGDGTLTQDTTLARTAPGVLTATGTLAMTGVGQTRTAYKALGTSRVSTATATDDPDLTMAVSGTGTYAVEFHLYYASGATGKFLTMWDVPAGVTGLRSAFGLDSSVSNATPAGIARAGMHAFTTGVAYGDRASTSELYALETGVVTGAGTDGVIALKWAQSVSNATSVGLGAGSWMRVTRIA